MNDDEEARLRLVGEISRLEEDAGGVDGAIASAKRRAGELDERRREGPCAHLCIGIVNVELIAVGAGLLLWGPAADDHAALGHSESVGSADSVLQAVGASSLAIGVLGLVTCCCSEPDSTSSYAYFVSMLLLTCGAAWASWFAVGNTPLVAAELQLHASQHWLHWLAVLGADTRQRVSETDPECLERYSDACWHALLALDGGELDLVEDTRFSAGLAGSFLIGPCCGLLLAKRRLASETIARKTESALALASLASGAALVGLAAFFSSGTHRLASKLGGWMMELFAGCGLLLMGSACTLCASPDGDTARKCSLATLSLLSAVFAVVVIACFWVQQPLFERMGEAVGGEIEEIFVDLRTAGICADPAGGGGNTTSPERCWDCCDSWEEAAGEPENGCLETWGACYSDFDGREAFLACVGSPALAAAGSWDGALVAEAAGPERNGTNSTALASWDCPAETAKSWDDLRPYVSAWLEVCGRWLVLLLGVVAARAGLLLRARREGVADARYANLAMSEAGPI